MKDKFANIKEQSKDITILMCLLIAAVLLFKFLIYVSQPSDEYIDKQKDKLVQQINHSNYIITKSSYEKKLVEELLKENNKEIIEEQKNIRYRPSTANLKFWEMRPEWKITYKEKELDNKSIKTPNMQ